VRFLARIALCVAAAIAYTFAFSVVAIVVYALTRGGSDDSPTTNGSGTFVVEADPLPTWVSSAYLAGLAGVIFLFGFRLWRRAR